LLLIAPDPVLVRVEPQPLRRWAAWVRGGGRLVVAPAFPSAEEEERLKRMSEELAHYDAGLFDLLGLPGVRVELMLSEDIPERSAPDDPEVLLSQVAADQNGPATDRTLDQVEELATLGAALPEVLGNAAESTLWETRLVDAHGRERVFAAGFRAGRGEIAVVSDATVFANAALRRGQNALWAAGLLAPSPGGRVIVDEFYHGLNARGNPWWLLTNPALATLAAFGLLLLGLWTWRSGVLLGPPLDALPPSRRSIGESISALGRFFLRGRGAPAFLLRQIRHGVWRELSREAGLPAGQTDVERLAAAIARHDPARAAHLREAVVAADALVLRGTGRPQAWVTAAQRLQACLRPPEP
jgi:hypothetical protein